MIQFSYWEHKYFWSFWDFCIIGCGITGLSSAIELKRKQPGAKVCIVERGFIPTGASTKNAGFACFGSAGEILDDLNHMSEKAVFELVEKRYKGLAELRSLLNDDQTGYLHSGGFEVFKKSETLDYEEALGSLSYINAELVNTIGKQAFKDASDKIAGLGFAGIEHMLVNTEEGMIDTGLMMKNLLGLAKELGINIYYGLTIKNLDQTTDQIILETDYGSFKAATVLVTTNGFAKDLLPELEINAVRAQVLVTKPINNLQINGCFHHNKGYDYFRSIDGRVLIGGGRNLDFKAEETQEFGTSLSIQNYLEGLLSDHILPGVNYEVDYRWSGIMGVGASKEVILKKIGPSVICAVRYGGMGVALGFNAGKEAATMALSN